MPWGVLVTDEMGWVAIRSIEPVLLSPSKYIQIYILKICHLRAASLPVDSMEGFAFIQNSIQNSSSGCFLIAFLSDLRFLCLPAASFSLFVGNQCTHSLAAVFSL